MTVPAWVRPYIGIPFVEHGRTFEGCDCWGLCRMVLADQWGVRLPSFGEDYLSATDRAHLNAVIQGRMAPWQVVDRGHERAGDLMLMRSSGVASHIGVVVAPLWVLHVSVKHEALCERYDSVAFDRAIEGIYRHSEMAAHAA